MYTQLTLTFCILAAAMFTIVKVDGSEKIYDPLRWVILAVLGVSLIGAPIFALISIWA